MKNCTFDYGFPIHIKIITYICSFFACFAFFFYVNIADCHGATVSWTNPAGGNWSNPDNWSTGAVPGSVDDVEISLAGPYTVTVDTNVDVMTVFVESDVTLFMNGRTVNASLINNGFILSQSTNTINGSFENLSEAMLRVLGTNLKPGNLTVAEGFINQGIIELVSNSLTHAASLRVDNGMLLNQGTIKSLPGVSGGGRMLYAELDNQGSLIVDNDLTVGESGDIHSNSGTIDVAAGKTLKFYGTSLGHFGGVYTGSGVLNLSNITLQLDQDMVYDAGMPSLSFLSGWTINGPGRFVNQRSLTLNGGTINAALINESTLSARYNCYFNGSFENLPNAMLRVQGISGRSAVLTVSDGFTNQGFIELTNNSASYAATLRVNNGVLLNQGTIKSLPGVSGGGRSLYAELDNQGSLIVDNDLTVGEVGDIHSNSGTIDVAEGKNLKFYGTSFVHSNGFYTGSGVLHLSNITLQLDQDMVYDAGMPSLSFLSGWTINGPGRFVNQRSLTLNGGTINATLINESTLSSRYNCYFNGSFENLPNAMLRVQGISGRSAVLTVSDGFTNHGFIELTNNSSSYAATLRVNNGVLLNQGTIKSSPGVSGGGRSLYVELDNQGSLIVDNDLNVGEGSDINSNSGTIDVAEGKILKFYGTSFVHSNGFYTGNGEVNLLSTVLQLDEELMYAAGMPSLRIHTVNGPGRFVNQRNLILNGGLINAALVNESILSVRYNCNFNGSFENLPNAILRVQGISGRSGSLTVADGFTNQGLIELTNNASLYAASLRVNNGVLLNQGTIKSLPGIDGGSRALYVEFDNRGSLIVDNDLTVGKGGDAHTNAGLINISSGKILHLASSTLLSNKTGGNITGSGTLDLKSTTLANSGHISPGLSLGSLALTGNINQDGASNLDIDIGGKVTGTGYDQLKVSGAATLNGILNINLANNFIPQIGDSFQVVTYDSHSGSFASVNPLTINGSLDWDVTYTPTGVQLIVVEGSEGLRLSMIDSPDPLPLFHELSYTLTVFNAIQETATNVTLTDTLPSSSVFASVTTSQGSCMEISGTVTCSLGELGSLSSAAVTITVVPTFVSTISNTATVRSDSFDPNPEDNTVTISSTVTDLPGDYDIADSPIDLGVTRITPNIYGNIADAVVTMSGIGFDNQTTISLISKDGVEYYAEVTEVDSLFQLTTFFDLSLVPVGRYDVKVSNHNEFRILEKAFEVIETQKANLETHLILPASFGRHAVATIYIEYANTGNVAMPAPMLVLRSADVDDSDKPLLTLDSSRIVQNLYTSTMPAGVGHTVQFLADGDGESPGILQPGESGRMPVYYTGLLRPWDFSDTKVELEIKIIKADEETPYDWESRKALMKPESMDDQAWDILFANLVNAVGDTWGDNITALSENAVYLYRHCNQTVRDINELFRFELAQAMGASHPLPYLAGATDIAVAAPGLPLVFSRSFSSTISDRFMNGTLGKGWSHSWQTGLEEDAEGNVLITSMNRGRRYQPDDRGGYFSPPGDYSTLTKSGDIFILTFSGGIIQRFRADGKLDCLEDLNGNRITAEYSEDLLSRLVHSAGQYLSFTYTGGRISTISDHTGELSVDFAYDLFGDQLTSVTDILGRTTEYLYYQSGPAAYAMAGVVYPDNSEESFNYDENGRLSETALNAIPQAYFAYDLGKVTMTAHADDSSHGFYYDAKGQLIKYVDPLGSATVSAFDGNYNLQRVTGPDGLSTSMAYDRNGNTTKVTDALGQLVKMGYGGLNRMTSIADAEASTTAFYYDAQGNNDSVIYSDNGQKAYAYDYLGNMTQRINRRGSAVDYAYDNNGFVLQKTYDDGSTVSYIYDDVGNITSVTDTTGTTTFTYYANHLLKRITYPGNLFLEYTYDSLGRRISVIDQSGFELQYAYNAFGQLDSIVEAGGDELVRYTYDSMQRLCVKTLGNGVATTYEYDLAGRLIHLVNYAADDSILSRFDYEYDMRGRRIGMSTLEGSWMYAYDKVGQLTDAIFTSSHSDIADKSTRYTYDKAGNRTEEIVDGSTIDYASNNMNQYSQSGNVAYNYDDDGNLIAKTVGGDTWQYSYNDDNKLVSISGPEGETEYQYDGLGNLTAVTEKGTTRYYLIDPTGFGNVVGEYDETGALLTRYTYGMGLISQDDYFYTFDGNGNTSELTGSLSEKANSYVYAPFGEVLYSSESVSNDFQYVGQFGIRQADNDLLYMRNRFYMPSAGRFISEDPIGLAGGINLYGYVNNDPINFIDPWGLESSSASLFGNSQAGFLNIYAKTSNDLKAGTLKSSAEGSLLHAGWQGSNGNLSGTADAYKWRAKLEGGITNYANFDSTAKIAAFEGETSGVIKIGNYYIKGTLGGSAGSAGYELKAGLSGVKAGLHAILGLTVGLEWGSCE